MSIIYGPVAYQTDSSDLSPTLKCTTSYSRFPSDDSRLLLSKGGYVLIIGLNAAKNICTGSLGVVHFPKGFYAYLGSARGGFKPRINRHLIKDKKPKWHIDYLLTEARILQLILCTTELKLECLLSQALISELCPIPRFGSSDCRCKSHLYFADNMPCLKKNIDAALATILSPQEFFKEVMIFSRRSEIG